MLNQGGGITEVLGKEGDVVLGSGRVGAVWSLDVLVVVNGFDVYCSQ